MDKEKKPRCCYCGQYVNCISPAVDYTFIPDTALTTKTIIYWHTKCMDKEKKFNEWGINKDFVKTIYKRIK